jgi:L-2,4-diaminobutyrate decarboxylase
MEQKMNYKNRLERLQQEHFLEPGRSNIGLLPQYVGDISKSLLLPGDFASFPEVHGREPVESLHKARLPETGTPLNTLVGNVAGDVQNMLNKASLKDVNNVIPSPSLFAIAVETALKPYMPNLVSEEIAGELARIEPKIAASMSDVMGLDPEQSGGFLTFGGTGTNLYGLQMGLHKAFPDFGHNGFGGKQPVVIVPETVHFSVDTDVITSGIGTSNMRRVPMQEDRTTNLQALESTMEKAILSGQRIAAIYGAAGTTTGMAIDDFAAIREIRDRLVEKHHLDYKPHIHADAVIGWAFSFFRDYDFEENKLEFPQRAIDALRPIVEKAKTLQYADSVGLDFHKTAFMPYVSSMILAREVDDLRALNHEPGKQYLFHDEQGLHPGQFTIETSRNAAAALAVWMTLESFGKDGMRSLLGQAIDMSVEFRCQLAQKEQENLYPVTTGAHGLDVLFYAAPEGKNVRESLTEAWRDAGAAKPNNAYTDDLYDFITNNEEMHDLRINKATIETGIDHHPFNVLKIYSLNPYMTAAHAAEVVDRIVLAKRAFDEVRAGKRPTIRLAPDTTALPVMVP